MKIIPLVVGSLGATPKQFGNKLKQICITAVFLHKFRRQFYLERLEYLERFLKSKPTGCGAIAIVFSSIVLLCFTSIIIIIIIGP